VTVTPDWKKLGLEPSSLKAYDVEDPALRGAEGRGEIALAAPPRAGSSTGATGFRVEVPSHDVRLVLASIPGTYSVEMPRLGVELSRPGKILSDFSDTFEGPALGPAWKKDLHEGHAGIGILDGKLYVQGAHYGYAHVRRDFGNVVGQAFLPVAVTVQCCILRAPTGCADEWGGSLILCWPNGEFVQATPGTCSGKFLYRASRRGVFKGQAVSAQPVPGWYPHSLNWVKIALKPDAIEFYSSADGKTWLKEQAVKRGKEYAGPPGHLLLGNGGPGAKPHFDNVLSKHFNPTNPTCTFFSDLIVGEE